MKGRGGSNDHLHHVPSHMIWLLGVFFKLWHPGAWAELGGCSSARGAFPSHRYLAAATCLHTELSQIWSRKELFFSPKYIGRGCWVWAVAPLFSDRSVIHWGWCTQRNPHPLLPCTFLCSVPHYRTVYKAPGSPQAAWFVLSWFVTSRWAFSRKTVFQYGLYGDIHSRGKAKVYRKYKQHSDIWNVCHLPSAALVTSRHLLQHFHEVFCRDSALCFDSSMLTLELYPAITALNGKLRFSRNLSIMFALRHAPEDPEACHEGGSDAKPGFKHIDPLRKFYASGTYSLFPWQISDRFTVPWLIHLFLCRTASPAANWLASTNHLLQALGKISNPERSSINLYGQADKAKIIYSSNTG